MTSGEQMPVGEEMVVLLVEDDEGDARLFEDELEEWLPRARVSRSRTLAEALVALESKVDCVVLDLGLPDALGMDAVARLRSQVSTIPLIVLTGLADEAAGVAAVEAGAQDYLVKGNVNGDQLARSIRYAIGRRQADDAERELILAEAQALEIARLERGLAPSLLIEDGSAWVASCYRAGRSRALLGGDFFDLVQRPDGVLHVLVGDVCGNGPDEAAIGVILRAAWRALALAIDDPVMVMQTLQHVFEQERHLPELFATVCTLTIEPTLRSALMIRAGHPRPVLVAGSTISTLSESRGNAGIGVGDERWLCERVELPANWTILLYTDGIIEGRVGSGPERLGEEGLHRMIAEQIAEQANWRERPDSLLNELIVTAERLNGDALSDDVAMLLIGAHPDTGRR